MKSRYRPGGCRRGTEVGNGLPDELATYSSPDQVIESANPKIVALPGDRGKKVAHERGRLTGPTPVRRMAVLTEVVAQGDNHACRLLRWSWSCFNRPDYPHFRASGRAEPPVPRNRPEKPGREVEQSPRPPGAHDPGSTTTSPGRRGNLRQGAGLGIAL